jgi:hypothetical protein
MFELGKLFSRKPDHPMNSVGKARDLLGAVDESDPVAALVEIGTWANSLAGADGFACDDRFQIVSEIEAAGSRVAVEVFRSTCATSTSATRNSAGSSSRCMAIGRRWLKPTSAA